MDVNDQHWQKGNLHTHSFWSDGDDFPEMIIDWYKKNDYQFIALSDHNTIANDDDYWYRLKQSDLKNKTFEKSSPQSENGGRCEKKLERIHS